MDVPKQKGERIFAIGPENWRTHSSVLASQSLQPDLVNFDILNN